MIDLYGADSIRWFMLSDSPPERDVQWSQEGVSASYKFIQKLWRLHQDILNRKESKKNSEDNLLKKEINKFVYNVTKNLDNFQYNVVIANVHEIYNKMTDYVISDNISNTTIKNCWEKISMMLVPLVPHLAHECCEKLNKSFYWPEYNLELLKNENCKIELFENCKFELFENLEF